MPRALRDTAAGWFHVTSHGVRDAALFRDDLDRIRFLHELARLADLTDWTCIGFCLMRTHYHLLVAVGDGVLPRAMHALNFRYAVAVNVRHGTRGHVLERRYYAGRIETPAHLLATYRYIARNPVTAGLCVTPSEWPWSGYRSAIGVAPEHSFVDPGHVLAELEAFGQRGAASLREFVES